MAPGLGAPATLASLRLMLRLRLEKLLLLPLLWLEHVLLDRLNMHTCVPVMAQIVGVVLVLVHGAVASRGQQVAVLL